MVTILDRLSFFSQENVFMSYVTQTVKKKKKIIKKIEETGIDVVCAMPSKTFTVNKRTAIRCSEKSGEIRKLKGSKRGKSK